VEQEKIRLLIADDQPTFAEGLKYVLESRAPDIEVVGLARDGGEALAAVERDAPDIVLMDVRMPGVDGVEAARRIHQAHPEVKVLMLTTFDDDEYVHDSLRNGAVGYLLKSRPPLEIIMSIRAVKRGILQIDPAVSEALFHEREPLDVETVELGRQLQTLTRREVEILDLLIRALDNRQIASTLNVAEQTVRNHVSIIYSKLGITNRMQILQIVDKLKILLRRKGPAAQT
jgi:DNA-binding NarL/FixJ family response regulator